MIRISPSGSNSSQFEWLMNTDLKGAIPRVLTRRCSAAFLVEYVRALNDYLNRTSRRSTSSTRASISLYQANTVTPVLNRQAQGIGFETENLTPTSIGPKSLPTNKTTLKF